MTSTPPAAIMLAYTSVADEHQGVAAGAVGPHDPDRHPKRVNRAEGVVFPIGPGRCGW